MATTNPSIVDYLNSQGQASDYNSRATLATQNGIQNYTGTADQNTQLLSTLSNVGMPKSNVVNVNTIANPTTPLGIPQTPTPSNPTTTVATAQDTIKNLQAEQLKINQDIATAQQQKLDPLYQQQLDLQAQITGKGAEQLQMEQNAGLTDRRQQLSNLNAAIAQQSAKFTAEQYNFSANGNPTTASISRKDDAIQLAMMTASAQGIQGNITAAETSINNAIKLKYDDIEQKLQYTKEFIDKNESIMTAAQQKVAADKSKQIDTQIAQIQKDKEDMTSLLINASAQGAPASLTQKAALAKTPTEAAQILGAYAGDYFKIKDLQSALQSQNNGNYSTSNIAIGNLTKESGMTIDDYLRGIAGTESGGEATPYTAEGPVVTSGMYAGDKAYGKYQVMGKNIPEWTKQAFGKAMTIQEFLASPEKQDALIKYRAEKDYAKYGNWDDVASVWFSGKPVANNNSSDSLGTTVPAYLDKMRKFAGSTTTTNVSKTAQSYLDMYNKGTMSIDDIKTMIGSSKDALPLKNEVVNAINAQGGKRIYGSDDATILDTQAQIDSINKLIASDYGAISGPIKIGAKKGIFLGGKGDALTLAKSILSSQTLKSLAEAKAKGITFGALSGPELELVAAAAGRLSSRMKADGSGFTGSESAFLEDLNLLKDNLAKSIVSKTGTNSNLDNWGGTVVNTYNDTSKDTHGYN